MTWDRRKLVGIATISFIGIISLGMLSAPRQVAMDCPDGDCQGPLPGSNNSNTVSNLLVAGAPQLRHMDDPQWQQWQASELASAWGFLSGRLLFARVAGKRTPTQLSVTGFKARFPSALLNT